MTLDIAEFLSRAIQVDGVTVFRPTMLALLFLLPLMIRRKNPADRGSRFLRGAAFSCFSMCAAGVNLFQNLPDKPTSWVVVADTSASISAGELDRAHEYIVDLAEHLPADDQLAVIEVDTTARLALPPGPVGAIPDLSRDDSGAGGTDLAVGLEAVHTLLPRGRSVRVLLLSDGNETRGDATAVAQRLTDQGARIDVIPLHPIRTSLISLLKVAVPTMVSEGASFPIRLTTENHDAARAVLLKMYVDGVLLEAIPVELPTGLAAFEVPYAIGSAGMHQMRFELSTYGELSPLDDAHEESISVTNRTRVLFVTPYERSLVAEVLRRRGFAIEIQHPTAFKYSADDLLAYNLVFFEDVTSASLTANASSALDAYVSRYGGGLIFAGGTPSFGDAGYQNTGFPTLLPVTMEPRRTGPRSRDPLALFLVIDRSNSMGYNSRIPTLHDGEKLRYAREAGLAVVRQLKDHDHVGLIAFDSAPHTIATLRPLRENRAPLERDLPRIVENGGTDFFDALEMARQQLATSPVSRRHVILLTDGDTNRSGSEHYPLIERIAADGISVTTIRIGQNDVNLRLLRDISERTAGQFYHVEDAASLPDLMLRDTSRAMGEKSGPSTTFLPQSGPPSEIVGDTSAAPIPPLAGYAFARSRRGADVLLHIDRDDDRDPLLAVWRFGRGRVAAYTCSTAEDAEAWPGWERFSQFWGNLVRWTARSSLPWEFQLRVHNDPLGLSLVLNTSGTALPGLSFSARLKASDGTTTTVPLTRSGLDEFSGPLPPVRPGKMPIDVITQTELGIASEQTVSIVIPDFRVHDSNEHDRLTANMALLNAVAKISGGTVDPLPAAVAFRPTGSRRALFELDLILLPMGLAFFLLELMNRYIGRFSTVLTMFGIRLAPGAKAVP